MTVDVTQMIEPAANALAPVGSSLSDAWSAVLGDRIAAWRLKNAAKLQLAINSELKALGIRLDGARIPERSAFAWFDEATKQDEPEIQQLFARLLARAATGDEDAADRRHLEILTRLTPQDAQVLAWLFENGGKTMRRWMITPHGKAFEELLEIRQCNRWSISLHSACSSRCIQSSKK